MSRARDGQGCRGAVAATPGTRAVGKRVGLLGVILGIGCGSQGPSTAAAPPSRVQAVAAAPVAAQTSAGIRAAA